ncbi:polynucleotidyl transferase, ribonuclease H-like superfamily protein [Actinidia rufa]|uniref:Polynucleotidyl transferase, ribonuclease H-like superfamily protein n=1 Tax=Actinidia rufa TaxID=165716 RepID=A0A7J0GPS5_9ERIC|nr:polynucleotidyl transferase, ribonuclease H-like superfamily protein [Actinidia rufa]
MEYYCSWKKPVIVRQNQGIDFKKNRDEGIDSQLFAFLLVGAGVVFNSQTAVTWVTFHGAYDFGFLIKLLTQNDLPPNLPMFMQLVRIYFGGFVLDLKHMMKFCDGLCGGLEKLAKALNVNRVVEKSHQAGPDSLLTMQTFLRLRDTYFHGGGDQELAPFLSVLHGLELQGMSLPLVAMYV